MLIVGVFYKNLTDKKVNIIYEEAIHSLMVDKTPYLKGLFGYSKLLKKYYVNTFSY